jgi:hypothetical protein
MMKSFDEDDTEAQLPPGGRKQRENKFKKVRRSFLLSVTLNWICMVVTVSLLLVPAWGFRWNWMRSGQLLASTYLDSSHTTILSLSPTHILKVKESRTGKNIGIRGPFQDGLWINGTVDTPESPVPVRLEEVVLVTNINANTFNLTVLNGSKQSESRPTTALSSSGTASSSSRRRRSVMQTLIHTIAETRPNTMEVYWKTRYAFLLIISICVIGNC